MALMTMDAAERIDYLQDQFHGAGIQVDNLTRAQKLALKESMGFSSVAEMMALLGSNTAEANKMRKKMDASQDIEKNMAKALENLLPIMEKITATFDELAANKDVIENITFVIDLMASAIKGAAKHPYLLATAIGSIGIAMKLVAAGQAAYIAAIAAGSGVEIAATASKTALSMSMKRLGIQAALVVAALGLLFLLFHETHSPANYLLAGVMAIGVFFLAKALGKMGPHAIVAAIALGVLGFALSAIFYGVSAMIDSMTGLFNLFIQNVSVLPKLASGMYLVGTAFLFMGGSAIIGAYGMMMGVAAMMAVFAVMALSGVRMGELEGVGERIMAIGQGIKNFGEGLQSIKSAAVSIKEVMADTLIAATMEGAKMSVVVGKEAGIATLFKNDTLNIKVDMPEIKMPTPNFVLEIDGEFIKAKVKEARVGATG